MRLNIFLPTHKPSEKSVGPLRRTLRLLGPSWEFAPVRRLIQVASLALFAVLFFWLCSPPPGPDFAEAMEAREVIDAETFLMLDPLAGVLRAALAGQVWIWALAWAGAMLAICLIIPRGFCGYVCPLGTLIDLFDWSLGRRGNRQVQRPRRWWILLKYYLLAVTLAVSVLGVLLAGFVAAVPILTRAMQFVVTPLQTGATKEWSSIPPMNTGQYVSIGLFCVVIVLGLLGPRFWCRVLCPTGAIFSLTNLLRITRRKVTDDCIRCGRCPKVCPFDAIRPDFTTRSTECTFCQTCGGVCPTGAIQFVGRWDRAGLKRQPDSPTKEVSLSRRGVLVGLAGGLIAATGIRTLFGADRAGNLSPVRPPGSIPENQFLGMCVRCGSCMKVCPTSTLQPLGSQQGLSGLWTPHAVPNWAPCHPECNACGRVCPTGAIRELSLDEKRAARMGRAVVNKNTCLPHANRQDCRLCVDACAAAGYNAIEFLHVGVELDEEDLPIEDTGYLAPVVLPDKCVGCGACQNRCYQVNVLSEKLLTKSAIIVKGGWGKADRIMRGSYRERRRLERERKRKPAASRKQPDQTDGYLPTFLSE